MARNLALDRIGLQSVLQVEECSTGFEFDGKTPVFILTISGITAEIDADGKPVAVQANRKIKSAVEVPKGRHLLAVKASAYVGGKRAELSLRVTKILAQNVK